MAKVVVIHAAGEILGSVCKQSGVGRWAFEGRVKAKTNVAEDSTSSCRRGGEGILAIHEGGELLESDAIQMLSCWATQQQQGSRNAPR